MKRFLVMSMSLGLSIVSVATARAGQSDVPFERTVKASYYGAQLLYDARSCAVSGAAGCVTIDTDRPEHWLTARARDAHGQPVSVWVVDASEPQGLNGTRVYGSFCGHTSDPINFDPGAKLEFWVGGEWYPTWTWWISTPQWSCFPSTATTGTISVTLSR